MGPKCSKCAVGYYLMSYSNMCNKCEKYTTATTQIIFVVVSMLCYLLFVGVLIYYVYRRTFHVKILTRSNANTNTLLSRMTVLKCLLQVIRNNIKITFSAIQIIVVLHSSLKLSFPVYSSVVSSFSWVDVGNLLNIFPVSCAQSVSDHVYLLQLSTIGPLLLSLVWWLTSEAIAFYYRRDTHFTKNIRVHFLYVFVLCTYLILPGVARIILDSFPCENIDPDYATGAAVNVLR